ncbi:MAG: MarR family transcriptional regulator [Candidatus Acidiferrum sp.]
MDTEERSLSRELLDLSSALKKIVRQELRAQAGAQAPTLTQFRILHAIKRGVCHVGKLSEEFGISQPATSIMVNAMVKRGLLKRVPHPKDRRQIELHLTPKAIVSMDTIYKRAFSKIDRRLSPLSAARRHSLAKEIREVSSLLSQSGTSGAPVGKSGSLANGTQAKA